MYNISIKHYIFPSKIDNFPIKKECVLSDISPIGKKILVSVTNIKFGLVLHLWLDPTSCHTFSPPHHPMWF